MNRVEWEHNTHSLRKLLHKFSEEDGFLSGVDRAVECRFGVQFNPMFEYFHVWDAVDKQTIATVKLGYDPNNRYLERFLMRYLPTTLFKEELLKFKISGRKGRFLPSDNVTRHDEWVGYQLQSRCERSMRERERFLERQRLETSPHIFSVSIPSMQMVQPYHSRLGRSGLRMEQTTYDTLVVRVDFGRQPNDRDQEEALHMVRWLTDNTHFGRDVLITIDELRELYRRRRNEHDQRRRMEEVTERAYREMSRETLERYAQEYAVDVPRDMIYGRPVEQVSEWVRGTNTYTEGTALTEEDIVNAVQSMDEQNVPRTGWDRTRIRQLAQMISESTPQARSVAREMLDTPEMYGEAINIPFVGREDSDV